MINNRLLAGTFVLVLIIGLTIPVYALPPLETMYGGAARGSGVDPGALVTIDQIDGSQVIIADNIAGDNGLAGLAYDNTGRLFGSQVGADQPQLHEFNPDTGAIINTVTVAVAGGGALKVNDLTVQPGTDQLFGVAQGVLYTIDKDTGVAVLVGALPIVGGGLAFAPDGTLYLTSATVGANLFQTIDPTTGGTILNIGTDIAFDGLGVRSDGTIFGARNGFDATGGEIFTIDAAGVTTFIGLDPSDRGIGDLDFSPASMVGGELIPIDATALLVGGLFVNSLWMLPALAGIVGAGAYLVRTRMNKE